MSFLRSAARARTPTLLQMEATECGAACLAIILAFYGRWVTLEELRLACGVSRNGSNASNILLAAAKYGLAAQGFRSGSRTLRRFQAPMILHWNFNHFVVLEGFGRGHVYLNDPATGPVTVDERELDESFTGIVLTFERGPDFQTGGRKPSFLAAVLSRVRTDRAAVLFIVLAGFALMAPRVIAPAFNRIFVDSVLLGGQPGWLVPLLACMVATVLLLGALAWLQHRALFRLESRMAIGDASHLLRHVLHLPVEFFSQRYAGDISSRLTISNRVAAMLARDLVPNMLSAVLILFYFLVMLRYDLLLTLLGTCGALLNFLGLRYFSRRRSDSNRRLQHEQSKLRGTMMAGLGMIETVKATGAESDLFVRWAGYQAKVVNLRQRLERASQQLGIIPPVISALVAMAILGFGSLRVMAGTLTVGELVAFQALMAAFLVPVSRLVGVGARLQTMEGDMHRLDDILRYPVQPGLDERSPPAGAAVPRLQELVLRDVTFGYDRSAPPLIEGFSLTLKPGARVALVGASGSGKSTIARLVLGLYEPWSGEIRFDGKPRKEIPRSVLTASLANVDQSIVLFEGTVRDNLTLWDFVLPAESVVRAARAARIHDEIVARPGGYDGPVEEGGRNWSGGQRQRLEIARALVGNPSILVLDEATSALDPITEREIDQSLRRQGAACLIIAHRLSTIRDADEIIVLDRGRIAQRGTHDQLKDQDGIYASLLALL